MSPSPRQHHDFMYEACDVPAGRTLREYTRGRPARREFDAATVDLLTAISLGDARRVARAERRFAIAALAVAA